MQNLYKGVQVMSPAGNPVYSYPLFDTFWNNTGLRGTVFEGRDFPDEREEALEDFKNLVNSISSELYNFIQVK